MARAKPTRGKGMGAPLKQARLATRDRGCRSNYCMPPNPSLQGRCSRRDQCGRGAAVVAGAGLAHERGTPCTPVAGQTRLGRAAVRGLAPGLNHRGSATRAEAGPQPFKMLYVLGKVYEGQQRSGHTESTS